MGLTAIIWSMVASACLTLATMHLIIWLRQRNQRGNLLFSITAVSVAAIAACELLAMRAQTPEQFARAVWWAHLPLFFAVVSIVGFVLFYFHTGRPWLGYTVCALRLLALVINFFSVPNSNYKQITSLRHPTIFGEPISVAVGVRNPWNVVAELSSLLLLVFVVDASVTLWRQGDRTGRRRAVIVGGGMIFFILMAATHSALLHWGLIQSPYLISFSFLAVVAAMGYELSWNMLRAAQLVQELQASEAALRESEQQMSLAASAGDLAMWTWDVLRDQIRTTEKGRTLFGFSRSEKINFDRLLNALHPEDREAVRYAVTGALNGAGDYESEHRVVMPAGVTRWIAGRGRVEFAGGKAVRMRGVSFDITRRKQAEERFRLVVEASPNAMIVINAVGRIDSANAQAEAIFGYTRHELVGHSVESVIPELISGRNHEHSISYLRDREAPKMWVGRELFGWRKDGSGVPIEIALNPIHTQEGQLVLASIVDITQRRQAELEAARQRSELARMSRVTLLGELSASLAHELNQPLGAIAINTGAALRFLARDAMNPEGLHEILEDIAADARRAGEVIRGIKEMARKRDAHRQRVNLNDVVTGVIRLTRSDALAHDCAVFSELYPNLPNVEADLVQLQQVFLNLILNAFEASQAVPKSRRKIIVRTECEADGNVLASVRDFGPGLPAEAPERVFEQFFSTKKEGMGIGLCIAQSIASEHGGTIQVRNAKGGGAEFSLRLPSLSEVVASPRLMRSETAAIPFAPANTTKVS
jgi:two-component system, LuxR family, sensor kinase FixL